LAYLIPSEMNCKVAVLELVRAAFWVVERGDAEAPANIIRSLCTCVIERREYVQRVIVDALEKRLSDAEVGPSLLFCVMLLSDQTKIAPFGTNSSLPFAKEVREGVQLRAKANLYRSAIVDASCAYVYSEWYHDAFDDLYQIHGIAMLLNDRRPWPKGASSPGLIVSIVVSVAQDYFGQKIPLSFREWAIKALEVIGKTTDPGVVLIKNPLRRYFRVPHSLWFHALGEVRANLFALRGLLLIYRLVDDSANRAAQNDPSMVGGWQKASQTLHQHISKLIERNAPREGDMFEFWPKVPPLALKVSG